MVTDSSTHEFTGDIESWFQVLDEVYQPQSPVALQPERFSGRICRWRFGTVEVASYMSGAMHYRRTLKHVGPGCQDHYFISIPRSLGAEMNLTQEGRSAKGVVGTMIMQHTSRPSELVHPAVSAFTVGIEGLALRERFRRTSQFVALAIPCERSACALFTSLAESFINAAPELSPEVRDAAGGKLADLLAIALEAKAGDLPELETGVREAHRARAYQYIDRHYADPCLSPGLIANACKISLRYLQQLFAESGTSVLEAIMEVRLLASSRMLRERSGQCAIATIAYTCGFSDPAHFSRRFSRRFGLSPMEYRAGVRSRHTRT